MLLPSFDVGILCLEGSHEARSLLCIHTKLLSKQRDTHAVQDSCRDQTRAEQSTAQRNRAQRDTQQDDDMDGGVTAAHDGTRGRYRTIE
jgi:hypothetical protein